MRYINLQVCYMDESKRMILIRPIDITDFSFYINMFGVLWTSSLLLFVNTSILLVMAL